MTITECLLDGLLELGIGNGVALAFDDAERFGALPLLNSEWVTRSRTDRSLRVYVHAKQTV
jgi:hypothetical protein